MMNRKLHIFVVLAAMLVTAIGSQSAWGDTFFNSSQTYRRVSDSPFWTGSTALSAGAFRMENFEDGLLNVNGVTGRGGAVQGPSSSTDSVDGDGNHVLDGSGRDGSSYLINRGSNGKTKAVFSFDRQALGKLPTFAGLVWTDGRRDATVTFKAFDANGRVIGRLTTRLGDTSSGGTTAEDRFLGASYSQGISKIVITASIGSMEIDHLQFGFGNFAMAVVPVPPALGIGAVGLLVAGVARKRMLRAIR